MTKLQEQSILQWYETIPLTCLKIAVRLHSQGQEERASQLLISEQDKLRVYPELEELLKTAFPTYKNYLENY